MFMPRPNRPTDPDKMVSRSVFGFEKPDAALLPSSLFTTSVSPGVFAFYWNVSTNDPLGKMEPLHDLQIYHSKTADSF